MSSGIKRPREVKVWHRLRKLWCPRPLPARAGRRGGTATKAAERQARLGATADRRFMQVGEHDAVQRSHANMLPEFMSCKPAALRLYCRAGWQQGMELTWQEPVCAIARRPGRSSSSRRRSHGKTNKGVSNLRSPPRTARKRDTSMSSEHCVRNTRTRCGFKDWP